MKSISALWPSEKRVNVKFYENYISTRNIELQIQKLKGKFFFIKIEVLKLILTAISQKKINNSFITECQVNPIKLKQQVKSHQSN